MIENRNNNANLQREQEQADLTRLMTQLWHGRVTVVLAVIISLIVATAYIFIAKEKWISSAIITQPDAGQISSYSHALNVIYGNTGPRIPEVQRSIIERFNSSFSALSESLANQDEPEKLTIDPAVKGQDLPLKVTYTGRSAEDARKILATYIQRVDDEVAKELEVDLASTITARKLELQQFLATQETVATEQKDLRVSQIIQALTVAKQANIKTPQVNQADQVSQDTMFMLGSDALSSMVKNESTRPLPFPDTYYQTRQSLIDVSNLERGEKGNEIKAENLHAYRYVMKPSLPIRRESPKRPVVIILAILLGGLIGSSIVFSRNTLSRSNKS